MKRALVIFTLSLMLLACKDNTKASQIEKSVSEVSKVTKDSSVANKMDLKPVAPKTIKEIKDELTAKGYKTFDYVDESTQDTIIMQQYFMAFLKKGPIRMQNEEESAKLQKQHLAHLKKMYDLGYADISGPFGDDSDMRGVTIYNVPTLKMADSLANSDPMVIAGRLVIEIHPWWAAKGYLLR
ncbi:MAG: YciI family protein [Algibacter sp.]|uniref:YciI family protein n=1 Tax=Algibacter sp. TaxID=1872428 RepID=UPI003296BDFF